MPSPITPFVETEILLAVMNDDREAMVTLVNQMSTSELVTFQQEANRLSRLIFRAIRDREGENVSLSRDEWKAPSTLPAATS